MELGQTVMTRGIAEAMEMSFYFKIFVIDSLKRYEDEDWGEMCREDWRENDNALAEGRRVFASYALPETVWLQAPTKEDKIWIITEGDRSCTTILFPEEY